VGGDLDHRLQELRLHLGRLLLALEGGQDLVDPGDELEALAVQELEFLLDPEAERRALAEVLLQCPATAPPPSPRPG
jgi:hypothetical protein